MEQAVSLPTYDARVAWSEQIPGIFTVGYSRVGGTDVLGQEFPEHTYTGAHDDLSPKLLRFNYQRGRSDDLTEVVATQGAIEILDPDETYNPHNRDSPIQSQLIPLRPYRLRATGPKLVRLTTNGWQIDDGVRARSRVGDDFEQALLRKRPLAFWRLDEAAGVLEYNDAAGDPDAYAYPPVNGSLGTPTTSFIAGDPGRAQVFETGDYLTVNHTDSVNPRATFTVLTLLSLPVGGVVSPGMKRYLLHKPGQWGLYLDDRLAVVFHYLGTDDYVVSVRSSASVIPGLRTLLVVSWDGKTVRMWLNGDEVEVGPVVEES